MDQFAKRPARERAEVFEETAARRNIGRPAIIEKDFWVCWTLLQLRESFGQPAAGSSGNGGRESAGMLFKGGTSLSKVYGAIRRFSEDIDLTIDRTTLGFGHVTDAILAELSNKKRDQLLNDVHRASAKYIAETIAPLLSNRLAEVADLAGTQRSAPTPSTVGASVDWEDSQTLHVAYPRALSDSMYASSKYVRAEVSLEFGARGELWPAHRASVRPYVAEEFTTLFTTPEAHVNVLDLARTLWEKATILHEIAYTGLSESRNRFSRHYYDLAQLVQTEQGHAAITQTHLLARVADHKSIFFRKPNARYDLARAGTLRLIPPEETLGLLRRDYAAMEEMFFGTPPSFDDIIETLRQIEAVINGQRVQSNS